MTLKKILKALLPKYILFRLTADGDILPFKFDENSDPKADIKNKYGFSGDILDIFANNRGDIVHKWHHYLPLYDRYFSKFRNRPVRFLEIGVSKGGSLQIWRKYFGEEAVIYGIDIDPNCAAYNGVAGQVRIGSQDDTEFLASVIEEMGGIDVVLDDGSHQMRHINDTLRFLFPKVNDGGIYMIEDLHAAYWKSFGGGYLSKSNFFAFSADLIDDLHHWYHGRRVKHPSVAGRCRGIHVHDSIVVFDVGDVFKPTHSHIG